MKGSVVDTASGDGKGKWMSRSAINVVQERRRWRKTGRGMRSRKMSRSSAGCRHRGTRVYTGGVVFNICLKAVRKQ